MDTIEKFIEHMPKVELHVHLEGSIRPATLLQLARRNSVSLPVQDLEELRDFYRFRDFGHFIEVYGAITSCLCTPDDYRLVAYEFGSDCARQNIRYAEVTFTIATNVGLTGLDWQIILEGLNEGRTQARDEFGVDWGWVLDISRNVPDTQDQVLEIALAARERGEGVVALGLGGPEAEFPPELFERSFVRAHQAGLPCVPHAGETAGPESIWTALHLLHADRLGHGVRCVEDPALVEHLREYQVPLEICPTSNICLKVFPSLAAHSLPRLMEEGLYITINSDDPPMFNTTLTNEYIIGQKNFNWGQDTIERLVLNAVNVTLLPENERETMCREFKAAFERLKTESESGQTLTPR